MLAGISVCRNQDLANVFYRLHLIEAYGTGISKIMRAYAGQNTLPLVLVTKNTFKIVLPNINEQAERIAAVEQKAAGGIDADEKKLGAEEKAILTYAETHDSIKSKNVMELLGVSASTALRLLKRLVMSNELVQHGKARNTYYSLAQ